jgi:HSP20 family protein
MAEKSVAVQTAQAPASLKVVEPKSLFDRINQMQQAIARRAFELFEWDGGLFGRDLEHWFRAEAELLHPVHMSVTESDDALAVQAEVPGFSPNELEVSIEARRLTISGKKESREERKKGKTIYQERCSNEILRAIDLPAEVDATKATATLKNGLLELTLPKTAKAKSTRVEVKAA